MKANKSTTNMSKIAQEIPKFLPPWLYPGESAAQKAHLKRLRDEGKIRPVGPRLYSSLPEDQIPKAIRGSWSDIASNLFPNALLSHRSALEFHPTSDGVIYLTGNTNRRVEYTGLIFEFVRGPKPLVDDPSFMGFHASSLARALLENLSTTKTTADRSVSLERLEARLEKELTVKGEAEFNLLRDRARAIGSELGWEREFKKLDRIIGAILGSRPVDVLSNPIARARAIGRPFDPACNEKLEELFSYLKTNPISQASDTFSAADHFTNKAFFESYFSNYIEGTTFEIEEAEKIVFDQQIPSQRPKDAHDILGTYELVSDPNELKIRPTSADELEEILRRRHKLMMGVRTEVNPGAYKDRPNRAGDTVFVHPEQISGTLEKGFQKYRELPHGLARAIFMMFLVVEVHPFVDGNGRLARVMMNAELFSEKLSTIIIPTVFREDYLLALRALSRRGRVEPLVSMLSRAQKFSTFEFSPYANALKILEQNNWFREPKEAKLIEV